MAEAQLEAVSPFSCSSELVELLCSYSTLLQEIIVARIAL
jgi:hypothetical protein